MESLGAVYFREWSAALVHTAHAQRSEPLAQILPENQKEDVSFSLCVSLDLSTTL